MCHGCSVLWFRWKSFVSLQSISIARMTCYSNVLWNFKMFYGIISSSCERKGCWKLFRCLKQEKTSYNIFFYKYLYCSTTFLRTIWFVSAALFSWRYSSVDIYNDTGKLMKSFKHLLGNRQVMPSDTFTSLKNVSNFSLRFDVSDFLSLLPQFSQSNYHLR